MRYVLLAIIMLELPLQIDRYFLHDARVAEFGTFSGFCISISSFCIVGLYCLWIPQLVAQSRLTERRPIRCSIALLLYLGASCLSIVMARDKLLCLFELFLLGQSFLLYLYVANNLHSRGDVLYLLSMLIIGIGIQGVFMLAVSAVGHDFSIGPIDVEIDDDTLRTEGSLGSPILAASYLAMMTTITFGVWLSPIRWDARLGCLIALLLAGVGLILTQSRGSWLGTGLACGAIMVCLFRRGWLTTRAVAIAAVSAAICLAMFQNVIYERLTGDDRGSAEARIPLAKLAWEVIQDHPFGVGINNSAVVGEAYAERPGLREEWFYCTHNKYLVVWQETSLLGLIAFGSFLIGSVRIAWTGWLTQERVLATISLAIAFAICGQMLHMMVDVFAGRPQVQLLWVAVATATAIRWMNDDEGQAATPPEDVMRAVA